LFESKSKKLLEQKQSFQFEFLPTQGFTIKDVKNKHISQRV
jgi:hypothetical protein